MPVNKFGRSSPNRKVVRGPPGVGFSLTTGGDFDIGNKRLCHVADAIDDDDVVNKRYLHMFQLKVLPKIVRDVYSESVSDLNNRTMQSIKVAINNLRQDIESKLFMIERKMEDIQGSPQVSLQPEGMATPYTSTNEIKKEYENGQFTREGESNAS
ncbi:TPA_asm: tail [Bos-associated insect adintovirus]|uniref:Tail n=1 Tax=Bos-associated insect adintovirus TaxID=2597806 RepID=A0A5H3CKS3_9VIRU|nr:TPA_asm: tail [Bos-associated insect adintovirus]